MTETDKPSLNICMITQMMPSHTHGGVQDHTQMLANGLAQRGHEVHILTTAHNDGRAIEQRDGISVHYLAQTIQGRYTSSWWDESCRVLQELHNQNPFDIIHSQGAAGYAIFQRDIHWLFNIPAIVSYHGTYFDELVTRLLRGFSWKPWGTAKNIVAIFIILKKIFWWDFRSMPHADGVIATSNEQAALLKKVYAIPKKKIFTVFNGMDLHAFMPGTAPVALREKFNSKGDIKIIVCVARLIRDKGVQNAIAAMPIILQAIPTCILVIVGKGNYRSDLERLAERKKITTHVKFIGGVDFDSLPDYFRLCDLFLNATVQQNGYDLTMIEAMACEKVVVSSNIGSTPTLITHNVDGILFPTANIDQLAREVIGILNDDTRRAEIGIRARQKVLTSFTLETMVEKTIETYRSLIKST